MVLIYSHPEIWGVKFQTMPRPSQQEPSQHEGPGDEVEFFRASLAELFVVVHELTLLLGHVFGVTYVDVVFKLLLGVVGVVSFGKLL